MTSSRPRRPRWASIGHVAALVAVVVTVLAGGTGVSEAGSALAATEPGVRTAPSAGSGADDPVTPDDEAPTVTDNEFWPEERDIGECLGALERPGCGSEERGGWRQAIVFGVVVAALALIGWRLFVLVRRRDTAATTDDEDDDDDHDDRDSGHGSDTSAGDPPSRSGV